MPDPARDVDEGDTVAFTFRLSHASAAEVRVRYDITGLVLPVGSGTLTFPLGEGGITATTAMLTLQIPTRTDLDTGTRSLNVGIALSGHSAAGRIDRTTVSDQRGALVRVRYTDADHAFTLSSPAAAITETDADANTQYTLAHSGAAIDASNDLVVTWTAITAGAATPPPPPTSAPPPAR